MRIVCDATLAFIKRCNVLSAIIEMADFREQRACIKFCFKLGKTATECYEMLKTAFGEQAMGRSQTFQWFSRFKAGRTWIDDDEHSGRPVFSSTPEMIERVCQFIRKDRRRTIGEVSMLVGLGLRENVRRKQPDQWRNNTWLLHHDNAPAHAVLLTRQFLTDNNMTVVPHPPYSPDFAPSDFSYFQN